MVSRKIQSKTLDIELKVIDEMSFDVECASCKKSVEYKSYVLFDGQYTCCKCLLKIGEGNSESFYGKL